MNLKRLTPFMKGKTMTISQGLQDDVCKKLRMIGLPRADTLAIVNSITRQVRCEGPENVVKRLKNLKQAAVNFIAGQSYDLPWIAHSSNGKPKGPWKRVWILLESKQHKHQKRALNAMMVYASIVLPKRASPTPTQERKFLSSVSFEKSEVHRRTKILYDTVEKGGFSASSNTLKRMLEAKNWKPDSSRKNIPDIQVWLAQRYSSTPELAQRSEKHLHRFLHDEVFNEFYCMPQVKKVLGELGEDHFWLDQSWMGSYKDWKQSKPVDKPIGTIGSSQEPGLKFRAFASPNLVIQCSLERLKINLLEALKCLPWDCTHNQESGVSKVQQWLVDGKQCFSVDLSDATNNFPLVLQEMLLVTLGVPEDDRLLFNMVSRSPYKISWNNESVSWNIGQPLGAGPSFPAFSLTHGLVVLEAIARSERKGGKHTVDEFLILGDDFITCSPDIHREYRSVLRDLSCPVSESKCLVSHVAGEFAGKLITKDHVFHGFKFKEISDLSFMSVVRTLGSQAISKTLLTKHQYTYCKLVSEMPEPFGLGFNPKGRSLADRYEELLVLLDKKALIKRDTDLVSASLLVTKYRYLAMHNKYYRLLDCRTEPVEKQVPIRPPGNMRDEIAYLVSGERRVIPSTRKSGDPRENPLEDALGYAAEQQKILDAYRMRRSASYHPSSDPVEGSPDNNCDRNRDDNDLSF